MTNTMRNVNPISYTKRGTEIGNDQHAVISENGNYLGTGYPNNSGGIDIEFKKSDMKKSDFSGKLIFPACAGYKITSWNFRNNTVRVTYTKL